MATDIICQNVTEFELEDRKKTLWSLSLTSRRFHTIVEDYIFADLSLVGDKDNKHNDDGSYRRTHQLVHRLITKPDLCRRVKSVKIDSWEVFAIYSQVHNRFDQDHNPATQLLALLPEITISHLKDMLPPSLEVFTHIILGEQYASQFWFDHYSWGRVWKQVTDLSMFPNVKRVETATYGLCLTEDVRREIWSRSKLLEKEKKK
jgi:hypothetical protein